MIFPEERYPIRTVAMAILLKPPSRRIISLPAPRRQEVLRRLAHGIAYKQRFQVGDEITYRLSAGLPIDAVQNETPYMLLVLFAKGIDLDPRRARVHPGMIDRGHPAIIIPRVNMLYALRTNGEPSFFSQEYVRD